MWSLLYRIASPKSCYQAIRRIQPLLVIICFLTFSYGLFSGLILAPADYQQGDAYRIMFIHVPAAIWSLGVYMIMSGSVIIYWVWKIKVADMIAKVSAPLGASFTFLALITGALWGAPTWGTWWIWDARLTSELLLLFIYAGIIILRQAMPNYELGAKASGMLTLIGIINIPIIHYSVNWWQTLHQGATILKFAHPSIAPSMFYPLLIMIIAFFFYYLNLVLMYLRCELVKREQDTQWVKDLMARG